MGETSCTVLGSIQGHWLFAALAGLGLALAAEDAAADGMRCGTRLVSKGDSTYEVKSRCGKPQEETRRVETRTERRRVRVPCAPGGVQCDRVQEVTIDVIVDEWIYDFGPQQFVRYLTFLDGRLANVATGSYGTDH
jgi:hypothetical protein